MVNSKRIGSIEVMVASSVVVPVVPPVTRLPDGHAPVADASRDRRAQLGELEIERGLAHGRLLRRDGGLGHALGLRALIEGLLRDGAAAHEALPAREIGLGKGEVGAGLREVGLGLRQATPRTAGGRW